MTTTHGEDLSTMPGSTVARRRRFTPSPEWLDMMATRPGEIQTLAEAASRDDPDVIAFLERWKDRYNENNLIRLWVQNPRATALHKARGWRTLGRKVRPGEVLNPVLLMHPRVSRDETRVTPDNPKGEQFHGASWMALYDFSQTDPAGGHTDTGPDLTPAQQDELKRLRAEALAVHPDLPGGTTALFHAAWGVYEATRDRYLPRNRNQGDTEDRA